MSKSDVQIITPERAADMFKLMKQLRPHLTEETYLQIYHHAQKQDNYTLYGYFAGEKCVGLMGLRYLHDFVHGFHVYIDDLVVDEAQRSQGIGAKLLQFAEKLALENNCTGLRLCTGVENQQGMKFYERQGWSQRAVVYKKKSKTLT